MSILSRIGAQAGLGVGSLVYQDLDGNYFYWDTSLGPPPAHVTGTPDANGVIVPDSNQYVPYNVSAARPTLTAYLASQAATQTGVRPITITNPITTAVTSKFQDWATFAALTFPAWGTVLYLALKKKR